MKNLTEHYETLLSEFSDLRGEWDAIKDTVAPAVRRECQQRIKVLYREIREVEAALAS